MAIFKGRTVELGVVEHHELIKSLYFSNKRNESLVERGKVLSSKALNMEVENLHLKALKTPVSQDDLSVLRIKNRGLEERNIFLEGVFKYIENPEEAVIAYNKRVNGYE